LEDLELGGARAELERRPVERQAVVLARHAERLAQATRAGREQDGLPLDRPPFELRPRAAVPEIITGPRVGITRARELPWRFGVAGSRFLSRRLARA